jgi:hypothetical protein
MLETKFGTGKVLLNSEQNPEWSAATGDTQRTKRRANKKTKPQMISAWDNNEPQTFYLPILHILL